MSSRASRTLHGLGLCALAVATAGVLACVLAGCAPASTAPPPPTSAEVPALLSLQFTSGSTKDLYAYYGVQIMKLTSDANHQQYIDGCLRKGGADPDSFGASTRDETALVDTLPDGRKVSLISLNDSCQMEYPYESMVAGLRTVDQLNYEYNYYAYELVPCLRGAGLDIPDMDSRTVWIQENYQAAAVTPYAYVRAPKTSPDGARLRALCPPTVPGG